MSELSVDQTKAALSKARSEFQRTSTDLENANANETTTEAEVNRAQSAVNATEAQIEAAASAHASILAQESKTNPSDEPALRRLAAERSFLESKRRALEGRRDQLRAASEKAQTDVDAARAAVTAAEEALTKAKERVEDADHDAEEARLVADGKPLPYDLAERREKRVRIEKQEHEARVQYVWTLVDQRWPETVGEGRPSHDEREEWQGALFQQIWGEQFEGKKKKLVPRPSPRPPSAYRDGVSEAALAGGRQGTPANGQGSWGLGSAGAGTYPIGTQEQTQVNGGTSPQWDPYANEEA